MNWRWNGLHLSWPGPEFWPDWFFWTVPGSGFYFIPLLTQFCSIILVCFGLAMIWSSYKHRKPLPDCERQGWWTPVPMIWVCTRAAHLRNKTQWLIPANLTFWLGAFMVADSTLYFLLTLATLRSHDGFKLWVLLYFLAVAFPAFNAFRYWLKGM